MYYNDSSTDRIGKTNHIISRAESIFLIASSTWPTGYIQFKKYKGNSSWPLYSNGLYSNNLYCSNNTIG